MTIELWVAVLSFMTAAAGAFRWLIHVYWSQAKTIEDLRHQNEKKTVQRIERQVDEHRKEMSLHKAALSDLEKRLIKTMAKLEESAVRLERMDRDFAQSTDATIKRISEVETKIITIAKDVFLIRGGKGGS